MLFITDNIDWHSVSLSLDTKIDAAYKNTQNVRRFFRQHLGDDFHFDRAFMHYIKLNRGITLRQVVDHCKRQSGK
jgi:Domain of unknown function (DUF6434)